MKKQTSTHQTEIEAQLPGGVSIAFREDSNLNPSTIIIIKSASGQNPAAADNLIRGLLTTLLAEL